MLSTCDVERERDWATQLPVFRCTSGSVFPRGITRSASFAEQIDLKCTENYDEYTPINRAEDIAYLSMGAARDVAPDPVCGSASIISRNVAHPIFPSLTIRPPIFSTIARCDRSPFLSAPLLSLFARARARGKLFVLLVTIVAGQIESARWKTRRNSISIVCSVVGNVRRMRSSRRRTVASRGYLSLDRRELN